MLLMGDEYGHTKHGNNNTWCHDTDLNWFLWDELKKKADFYRFYRMLIDFRKRHPILRRNSFLTHADIDWHGSEPFSPNWSNLVLAFTLKDAIDHHDLYIAFNAHNMSKMITIPAPPLSKKWHMIVDTAALPPNDVCEESGAKPLKEVHLTLVSHSAILLKAF
jgi:isoamylase/glycogen operon protein